MNFDAAAEPVEKTEIIEPGTLQGSHEQESFHHDGREPRRAGDGARQPSDKGHKYGPSWEKHTPRHESFVQKLKSIFAKPTAEDIEIAADDKPEIGPDFAHDFFNGGFATLRVEKLFPGLINRRKVAPTEAEYQSLDADINDIIQYINNVSLAVHNNPKLGVCIKNFTEAVYDFAKSHDALLKVSPEYVSPDDLLAKYLAYICHGYNQKLNQTNFSQLLGAAWDDEERGSRLRRELNEAVRSSLSDNLNKGFAVLEGLAADNKALQREVQNLITETHKKYQNDLYDATLETDEKAA